MASPFNHTRIDIIYVANDLSDNDIVSLLQQDKPLEYNGKKVQILYNEKPDKGYHLATADEILEMSTSALANRKKATKESHIEFLYHSYQKLITNKVSNRTSKSFLQQYQEIKEAIQNLKESKEQTISKKAKNFLKEVNPNFILESGETVLHAVARIGDLDAVKGLCDRGANLFAIDAAGNTPLVIAESYSHENVVNELMKRIEGPKKSVKKEGAVAVVKPKESVKEKPVDVEKPKESIKVEKSKDPFVQELTAKLKNRSQK